MRERANENEFGEYEKCTGWMKITLGWSVVKVWGRLVVLKAHSLYNNVTGQILRKQSISGVGEKHFKNSFLYLLPTDDEMREKELVSVMKIILKFPNVIFHPHFFSLLLAAG